MHPFGNADRRVKLRFESVDKLPVSLPEHGLKIVGLGRGRYLWIGREHIESREIVIVLPRHPVGLSLAQNGRRIIPVDIQGGIITCQCRGVIVHSHSIVAEDRKYLR